MNNKKVKEIIESVISNLMDSDAQLTKYFENGKVIDHLQVLNKLKRAIGELEDLCKDI